MDGSRAHLLFTSKFYPNDKIITGRYKINKTNYILIFRFFFFFVQWNAILSSILSRMQILKSRATKRQFRYTHRRIFEKHQMIVYLNYTIHFIFSIFFSHLLLFSSSILRSLQGWLGSCMFLFFFSNKIF